MSKAGRKRATVKRQPNGQASRAGDVTVTRATVLRAVMVNPKFGTLAGMARLAGEIEEPEYGMAKHIAAIVAAYHRAILIRPIGSPSAEQGWSGAPIDVETISGVAEAVRHEKAVEAYQRIKDRLQCRGKSICEATLKFSCDEHCTWQEREWAKVGLRQLVEFDRQKNRMRGG